MSYSLYELNEYIRQVLALNFSEALWVRSELAQVKYSRGHCYLTLVQKDEAGNGIVAQSQAVIWALKLRQLKKKLGFEFETVLQEGMEVLLQVKVDFHERFGLKLMVEDIDPAYTLGQLAMKRRETILKLKKEGLLEKNGLLPLPLVIQRIAILSSENAAGLKDFLNEISNNEFGYIFQFHLFPVAMQGAKVGKEIKQALKKINAGQFDILVIIRGGGSKLDLAAFDEYDLCENVAHSEMPVITGIGHEIDETVLDKVAHTSLKTPTAVAGFIVHHNMRFESEILNQVNEIKIIANQLIQEEKQILQEQFQTIKNFSNNKLEKEKMMVGYIEKELPVLIKNKLQKSTAELKLLQKSAQLLSPNVILKRGFTITSKDGKTIVDKNELNKGDVIETIFNNGKKKSVIK